MPTSVPVTTESQHLGSARDEWDRLIRDQAPVSPFLCSWWLEAPGEQRPVFVLVRDSRAGGALLGGLALQETRRLGVRRLTFRHQGVLCPDHLDLVARPGSEDLVTRAITQWATGPGSRLLDLDGLRQGSRLDRAWGGQGVAAVAPYGRLEGGDYLATRTAAFRRSVRRGTTALARDGVTHQRVDAGGLDAAWAALRRLHQDRPGRAPLLARLDTVEHAVAAAYALDEARLDVLTGPDPAVGPIAVSVAFTVAGRLSLYQLARSLEPEHASAGTVLLHAVIADAAAGGAREVDLLRGDEDYKARFVDERRELGSLRIGSGAGRAVAGLTGAALAGRRALGRARRSVRGSGSAEG